MSNDLSQNLVSNESVVSNINASGRPTDKNNGIDKEDENRNKNEDENQIIELNSYRFIIVIIFFF